MPVQSRTTPNIIKHKKKEEKNLLGCGPGLTAFYDTDMPTCFAPLTRVFIFGKVAFHLQPRRQNQESDIARRN